MHMHTSFKGLRWVGLTAWLAIYLRSYNLAIVLYDEATRIAQVTLYHYCQPVDSVIDSKSPLSCMIAPSIDIIATPCTGIGNDVLGMRPVRVALLWSNFP